MKSIEYMDKLKFLVKICLALMVMLFNQVDVLHACRLYVSMGDKLSDDKILTDLLTGPYSFKNLGDKYDDGWSLNFFKDGQGAVFRGQGAANVDSVFSESVKKTVDIKPEMIFGHLRKASSGCVEGVSNPHPFKHRVGDQEYLFYHNGGVSKKLLIELIGKDFLAEYAPRVCTYDPPQSWVDSELYFIFLLKNIIEAGGDVYIGLRNGLRSLYRSLPDDKRYLNFMMTDGDMAWVFRKGTELYYQYDAQHKISTVSSTIPTADQSGWQEFPEDTIGFVVPNQEVRFLHIMSDLTL